MRHMRARLCVLLLLGFLATAIPAQQSEMAGGQPSPAKDVDPLAMKVLRAVAEPVQSARNFSFKALISEEVVASNDQILTFFHVVNVTVQRPDKTHIVFRGRGQRVDVYGNKGSLVLYAPDSKLYVTVPAKDTIDDDLDALKAKGADVPIGPFLRSDFYSLAEKVIDTAYVIGRVKVFDQDVHQLAFSAPDADWQLWVTGGENPRFVRAEIVNKNLEGKPRTIIQFLDWDLNPNVSADDFTFDKPADAQEITFMPMQ